MMTSGLFGALVAYLLISPTLAWATWPKWMRIRTARRPRQEKPMTDFATPTDPVADAVQRLNEDVAALGAPVVLCLGCTGEYVQAAARGIAAEQLPAVHPAQLVVGGNGQCLRHVQFTDRPVMPGQTASGLFLAASGQGV